MKRLEVVKKGNFLLYKNSIVCLITNVTKDNSSSHYVITGKDSNNQIHIGNIDDWSNILNCMDALKLFENGICTNAIYKRNIK